MDGQIVTIKVKEDGTIELVNVWEVLPSELDEVTVTDFPRVQELIENPEPFIYKGGKLRERTEDEKRVRARELYDAVREGRLVRCKDDEIERNKRFFTEAELEEVEMPEQAIKRLKAEMKELRR